MILKSPAIAQKVANAIVSPGRCKKVICSPNTGGQQMTVNLSSSLKGCICSGFTWKHEVHPLTQIRSCSRESISNKQVKTHMLPPPLQNIFLIELKSFLGKTNHELLANCWKNFR